VVYDIDHNFGFRCISPPNLHKTGETPLLPVVYAYAFVSTNSSSFSMLLSQPKIFHGRESELKHIIESLTEDSSRVDVLGGGGMGKTSLARAAFHHLDIADKFGHRYFVSAEYATSTVELAALIGLQLC
jgi:hypothetical protein